MPKTFIIKDNSGKKLGEILYSRKKFTVKVPIKEENDNLTMSLNTFISGIRRVGDVILEKPILPDDPLFLEEVQNQLFLKGYIFIEKSK